MQKQTPWWLYTPRRGILLSHPHKESTVRNCSRATSDVVRYEKQHYYTSARLDRRRISIIIIIIICVHHTHIVRARPLLREMQSRGQNAQTSEHKKKLNKKLTMREVRPREMRTKRLASCVWDAEYDASKSFVISALSAVAILCAVGERGDCSRRTPWQSDSARRFVKFAHFY